MPPAFAFLEARSSSTNPQPAIPGLAESSLELDKRTTTPALTQAHLITRHLSLSPLQNHAPLTPRDASSTSPGYVPGAGAKPPQSFNNAFFIALFGILGAAMVIASIWFFFWAKNGGFHYQEGDWDDYKSTVLRRKGPDGKTLSNATKSTKLGYGASTIAGTQHYKWQKQAARSVVGKDEKGRKGVLGKRGWAGTHSVLYSDDYMTETFGTQTVSDMTEMRTEAEDPRHQEEGHGHGHSKRYRDRDVQQYKKEKPARVGGLNRVADGSGYGTTIAGSETMSESSEQPILPNAAQRTKEAQKDRAERKAREEATRMERRWRREAEEAAAALARENSRPPPPPPAHTSPPKKSAAPSSKPAASKQRQRSASRSASPKKRSAPEQQQHRDFSYDRSGPASEVLSTAYTGTTSSGARSASYYEEYRPRASENPRYSSDNNHGRAAGAGGKSSRQSSPAKKTGSPRKGGGGRDGGYRRGADSDLD